MYKRKKYHGGLKVLLSLLFTMLLGLSSTSFARSTITEDEAEYIIQYLFSDEFESQINNSQIINAYNNSSSVSEERLGYMSQVATNFMNYFNSNNNITFDSINNLIFTYNFWSTQNGNYYYGGIYYFNVNNTVGSDDLPYMFFDFSNYTLSTGETTIFMIDDNKQPVEHPMGVIGLNFYYPTHSFNFTAWQRTTIPVTGKKIYLRLTSTFNNDYKDRNVIFENIPGVVGFLNTGVIYSNYNFEEFYSTPRSYFLKTLYSHADPFPTPTPTPVPDGSGTITNPSGEVTGQIDLSGIENGIKDIKDTISGESEKIINAIGNANENYWGSGDDLTGEEQEEKIEENLNQLMENLEENLTQSKVIQALESGEAGFLDFFRNKGENEEAYDLAFQWNKVNYMGATLLESGDINISAMCREIPELGQLQSLIRAIFNFATAIAIIHQIYNLVLSTLGIDNPYLYEDSQEITTVDTGTGEYRQFYKRRKRRL